MEKNSIHIQYIIANELDHLWGTTVNSVGFQQINSMDKYPPENHPTRYLFKTDQGRILDEYQLIYITQGNGVFSSSGARNITIQEGNMFLLFPGERHSYKPEKKTGWSEYWIGFQGKNIDEKINALFFSKENPILNVGLRKELVNIYIQAINIAQGQKFGFQQQLAGIVEYLLGAAYCFNRSSSFGEMKIVKLINKAKFIIQEDLNNDITPKQIAQRLNISYSWFRKIFKQYTGFSPLQYILEIRIQKSKELLTNTDFSNIEIAYKLGFETPNYFCVIFKKRTKITPMQYRTLTQNK